MLDAAKLKVAGLQESQNLCSHSVVKLCKASLIFMMVEYVREMTLKKSCTVNMDII